MSVIQNVVDNAYQFELLLPGEERVYVGFDNIDRLKHLKNQPIGIQFRITEYFGDQRVYNRSWNLSLSEFKLLIDGLFEKYNQMLDREKKEKLR